MARGTAMKSYGVYVSELAGLPKPVVRRAEQLLDEYETSNSAETDFSIQNEEAGEMEKKLNEIDADSLSPVEALMKIYELKKISENSAQPKSELKRAAG